MRRSGEEARTQILAAAREEFARHGLSGARIDRIARQAGASKERLYAYFGDKDTLFDEVVTSAVRQVRGTVGIEDDDLVAYAGRLVEHFFAHPDDLRLLGWTRVEEQCDRALKADAVSAKDAEKADAVRRAQADGRVDPSWDPGELLRLILATATYWAGARLPDVTALPHYREVVEEATRRLVEPR